MKLVEPWRDYQRALAQHGDTQYTHDLLFDLLDAIRVSLLQPEKLDFVFERLHREAWPDAAHRPPRMHIGELECSILED